MMIDKSSGSGSTCSAMTEADESEDSFELIEPASVDSACTFNEESLQSSDTRLPLDAPKIEPRPIDEGESLFGDLLDEVPRDETTASGETFYLRDFGISKGTTTSLKPPRQLLEDIIRKISAFVKIDWQTLPSSRLKRAKLQISWPSNVRSKLANRRQTWDSGNVGCPTYDMVKDYVAVLALHSVMGSGLTTVPIERSLQGPFLTIWDDLNAQQKQRDDQKSRTKMKVLTSILRDKLESIPEKRSNKPPRSGPEQPENSPQQSEVQDIRQSPELVPTGIDPDQLRNEWHARAHTDAFQRMAEQRKHLPIAAYRGTILNTLESNQIVVLCGETGCGKSTQVPSFVLENELLKGRHCKIICTEPRRISAISLASRVSAELGESSNDLGTLRSLVGYSIRLENQLSRTTRLVYATTGIVLRMLEGSSNLSEWTHLLLDEVHERSIETDFLLIVLKTLLARRKELKVILMSATVDAEKFAAYMGDCPVLQVPGRTFPVTTQYLEDVIQLTAFTLPDNSPYASRDDRALKGKRRTTQVPDWNEDAVNFGSDDESELSKLPVDHTGELQSYSKQTRDTLAKLDEYRLSSCYELVVRLLECICLGNDPQMKPFSTSILIFLPGLAEIKRMNSLLLAHQIFGDKNFRIFPLHSSISTDGQGAVFEILPKHIKKIVLATNIAETGVTIPDIVCVIDLGKHKEMRFDEKRQISVLQETFISRANAKQRRGRAGRVQAGLTFHFFTRLRHDQFMSEHPQPEMERLSLQDLALRIKICKLPGSIEQILMQALSPPKQQSIRQAIQALIEVKALTHAEELTPLGTHLSKLPMDVHLGKMLLLGSLFKCLDPILTIAASLNSKTPFIAPFGMEQESNKARRSFARNENDFLALVAAFDAWRRVCIKQPEYFLQGWLRRNYLSRLLLSQIEELRQQYLGFLVDAGFVSMSEAERRLLSRARNSPSGQTYFSHVPLYLDEFSDDIGRINASLAAALYPKLLVHDPQGGTLKTILNNQFTSLHPSSVNYKPGHNTSFSSRLIAYHSIVKSHKLFVREAAAVEESSVVLLCGDADFKAYAGSLDIDRRLRYRLDFEKVLLLKLLRKQTTKIIGRLIEHPERALSDSQQAWFDTATRMIGQRQLSIEA